MNGMSLYAGYCMTKEERKRKLGEEKREKKEPDANMMANVMALNFKNIMDQFTSRFSPGIMGAMGGMGGGPMRGRFAPRGNFRGGPSRHAPPGRFAARGPPP